MLCMREFVRYRPVKADRVKTRSNVNDKNIMVAVMKSLWGMHNAETTRLTSPDRRKAWI